MFWNRNAPGDLSFHFLQKTFLLWYLSFWGARSSQLVRGSSIGLKAPVHRPAIKIQQCFYHFPGRRRSCVHFATNSHGNQFSTLRFHILAPVMASGHTFMLPSPWFSHRFWAWDTFYFRKIEISGVNSISKSRKTPEIDNSGICWGLVQIWEQSVEKQKS